MQAILLLCLLMLAATSVIVGVAMLSAAWAFIVGGVELATIALFSLHEAT